MKRVVFVGSFAPVHNGHFDIIKRLVDVFDEVIIAVTQNKNKLFVASVEDRKELLKIACKDFSSVKVMSFKGTLADFCHDNNVDCIVKAVRNTIDFEYEYDMAITNKQFFNVETLVMFSAPQYRHISSTLVREFLQYDKDITPLVPVGIAERIKEVFYVS